MSSGSLSVVIPALNEAANLKILLPYLNRHAKASMEIIVVDGGSSDGTCDVAREAGAAVYISKIKSRAAQMNIGARQATGGILYFLHADTLPPPTFIDDIIRSFSRGNKMGGYRLRLDAVNKPTCINSYFSRFKSIFSGGGDQSLFICREAFIEAGGFDEHYCIMEDFDFVRRMKKIHGFLTMEKDIVASARKYHNNSYLRVTFANAVAFGMFRARVRPAAIRSFYSSMIRPYD